MVRNQTSGRGFRRLRRFGGRNRLRCLPEDERFLLAIDLFCTEIENYSIGDDILRRPTYSHAVSLYLGLQLTSVARGGGINRTNLYCCLQ